MLFDLRMILVLIASLYLFYIFFESVINIVMNTTSKAYSSGITLGNVLM